MQAIILFDDDQRDYLKPFSFTRPVCEFRVGILTIREKWERMLEAKASFHTEDYLSEKYPTVYQEVNLLINGGILPTVELCNLIKSLPIGRVLVQGQTPIALKVAKTDAEAFFAKKLSPSVAAIETQVEYLKINRVWDIFKNNGAAIASDFELITMGRKSQQLSPTNQVLGDRKAIFLEEGASVECSILNTTTGPIYVGKNAIIAEGSLIRGGFALCESAQTKLGTCIYGPTTLGPHCKVGGEVNNSVFFGYSSKAHGGFLGNSVIGEWCNMGADTNNSNLKNNYANVRIWNYVENRFGDTGLQFCGLMMGDHSKTGINTMFNTGTVVGVSSNIYGAEFPRTFIPSFAWGGAKGFTIYNIEKAYQTARLVMKRRNQELSKIDEKILAHIFQETTSYRKFKEYDPVKKVKG